MAYNADLTWTDLSREVGTHARDLMTALRESKNAYDEWQSFRAGRDNATIATALGRTETEIAEMDAAFAGFLDVHDYADNAVPVQGDRNFAWRKFS